MPLLQSDYKAPRWLPGAHLQTIVPARFFPRPDVQYRREIVDMPDGDFIVLDWSEPEPMELNAPVLVHFHGLEGDSHSHYAEALMHECVKCGWRGVVAHFRGCGGLPNRLPRAYFAGDSDDCDWILRTVHERFITAPIYAVGVSLGGNYIAKYMGERPQEASFLTAAVSIGAPVDLVAGSNLLRFGFNRLYSKMFLDTLIPKVIKKCELMPQMREMVDVEAIKKCKNFYDFDSLYTAPVHGFKSAMDYWTKASAKPWLKYVQVPLLLLNAKNDPFMPQWALPTLSDVSDNVWLDQPEEGGHVGFPTGNPPGKIDYLPKRIFRFFLERR